MKTENVLEILRIALRVAETVLGRRRSKTGAPDTRADKLISRVAPIANKALDRVAPNTAQPAADDEPDGGSASFAFAQAAFIGTLTAGAAAYFIIRQRRRVRARYSEVGAPFPPHLLDVLAPPGGGGQLRLSKSGMYLVDGQTRHEYPVIDGIPDFLNAKDAPVTLPIANETQWLRDALAAANPLALAMSHNTNAALAGAVAAAANGGWALSAPCGRALYEIDVARANPTANIVCIDHRWDMLLEARRKALAAGVANLYFIRGDLTLLPVQDGVMQGAWSANGFHLLDRPERAMTQLARVTQTGAPVAGVSLVIGGARAMDAVLSLASRNYPGLRDSLTHFSLLAGAGLRDLRAFRSGGYVSFTAVRG